MRTLCQGEMRVGQTVLEGCARLPCHMLFMDIVATHHVVLGISILPDPATVRSSCNGMVRGCAGFLGSPFFVFSLIPLLLSSKMNIFTVLKRFLDPRSNPTGIDRPEGGVFKRVYLFKAPGHMFDSGFFF